MGENTRGNDVE
jgi:hypothetical protein